METEISNMKITQNFTTWFLDKPLRVHPVTDNLSLAFHPVVTQGCSFDRDTPPPVASRDIQRKQAYIPRWLRIHYRNGEWQGTFGY